MIEKIICETKLIAIIVRNSFNQAGITFFTPEELAQQVAFMSHPGGKIISAHRHNELPRAVVHTQEVLIIKKGRLRVDFYNDHDQYLESRIMSAGDVLLLVSGGHGFTVLEKLEMIEVKQGPYAGEQDKVLIAGVNNSSVALGGR